MALQIYAYHPSDVVVWLWPHEPDAPMPDPQPTPSEVFGPDIAKDMSPCDSTVQQGWVYDGKGGFAVPPPPPPPTADVLRTYAAAARFAKETGGITVGNAPIATDRDSQAMITGMWATAQMNPAITVQFKSAGGGFATINAAQIQSIAAAVSAHVQACFAAEGQIDAAITAGTITTTAQIDQDFAAITV